MKVNQPHIETFKTRPGKKMPHRVIIFPKDIENIIGLKPRAAQQLIQDIKITNGKGKHQYVTIDDFCRFTGVRLEEIQHFF